MSASAVVVEVGASKDPQQEKQPVGTCCPGVYLAKDQDGKPVEVEVVWRPTGEKKGKKGLFVLIDGAKGVEDHLVPVGESGLDFLAKITGIRPPHFECFD